MPKFKKGDICICSYSLRKTGNGTIQVKKDCKVRITSLDRLNKISISEDITIDDTTYCYNVYNIDYDRYEKIGEFYLKLDLEETRSQKLKKLLK